MAGFIFHIIYNIYIYIYILIYWPLRAEATWAKHVYMWNAIKGPSPLGFPVLFTILDVWHLHPCGNHEEAGAASVEGVLSIYCQSEQSTPS